MQSDRTQLGATDDFFESIEFEDVYHSSAIPEGPAKAEIIRKRCAEVLTSSPLELDGVLAAVLCRSSAERSFLHKLIGPECAERWAGRMFVHTEPEIFEKRWAFVESVDQAADGFYFRFHPRQDGRPCDLSFEVEVAGRRVWSGQMEGADLGLRWRIPLEMRRGLYSVTVRIDGFFAYRGDHLYDDQPF